MLSSVALLAVSLGACSGPSDTVELPADATQQPASAPAVMPTGRQIPVTVENWQFTPHQVMVRKGEDVTLVLNGISGIHGFMVEGLGINQPVSPGEIVSVKLPTGQPGTYKFLCSIPCGAGHADMVGTLTIAE